MPSEEWPERPPPAFYEGIAAFNGGEYYRCHEILETLWIPETRPVRELYQGVLQIATGCHHLVVRANWRGAVGLLEKGTRRLERAGVYAGLYGMDWPRLLADADRLQAHLQHLGPERLADVNRAWLPQIAKTQEVGCRK